MTKAEDKNLAVACSSVISRYIFLKEMDKLSDELHIPLRKGAGELVDEQAIEIIKREGIKVEGSDVEGKMMEISRLYGTSPEEIVKEIQKNPNLFYSLNQQIMGQKVTKFLLDNANISSK